ncbi:MAG: sugar phosphate isomerase/epimerase, partial [Planctomycetaceae bacterium]|nr:sugar phosphate isomerase/epimerase [Planctomycetaceae bacterium]
QASLASLVAAQAQWTHATEGFQFKYIVGSCMYGYTKVEEILPEIPKLGSSAIDIWPKTHGDQREQLTEMGEEKFHTLLEQHQITLGCITQYHLGPFGLKDELPLAKRLGCRTIVTGGEGKRGLQGNELRQEVAKFIEKMKPHLEIAAACDVTIAIENHANNLIDSPDSLKYLAELAPDHLGIALAPYHLPQDTGLLADLIEQLGPKIAMFYAWQHGVGCMKAQPRDQELLQMPGRGSLDFAPLVKALEKIQYAGWTEIFMHPFPRGRPILDTTADVTGEILRAKGYLEKLI